MPDEWEGTQFAGWLEEHPNGAFILLHDDGTLSPALTTYEALGEYLADGALAPVAHVIRVRRYTTLDDATGDFNLSPPLYPPETFGRGNEAS